MKKYFLILTYFLLSLAAFAEPMYILNESFMDEIYFLAKKELSSCENIEIHKDVRGTIIRIRIENASENYRCIIPELRKKLSCVETFLAKIKNPVIIEVHTENVSEEIKAKKWEIASVVAANIGDMFVKKISVDRIHTVGYGEFMPEINTPNNGGKLTDRVDIIILYSINGE